MPDVDKCPHSCPYPAEDISTAARWPGRPSIRHGAPRPIVHGTVAWTSVVRALDERRPWLCGPDERHPWLCGPNESYGIHVAPPPAFPRPDEASPVQLARGQHRFWPAHTRTRHVGAPPRFPGSDAPRGDSTAVPSPGRAAPLYSLSESPFIPCHVHQSCLPSPSIACMLPARGRESDSLVSIALVLAINCE